MSFQILLPLVTGAALLLIDETRHTLKALISIASTVLLLAAAVTLMRIANGVPDGSVALSSSYAVANWPAPFAIVLVLDRLSALMLVLTVGPGTRVAGLLDGALAPGGAALPHPVSVPADGTWRCIPDRGSV